VQTVSLIAPQLPYHNVVGATLLGTNLWGESPLVQAGGAYVEQAIFATPFLSESQSPQVTKFRERYRSVYGTSPSYLEAQAYDAMMLFLDARSAAYPPDSVDRASFLQNLLGIRDFQGIAGVYSFTPTGELHRDYVLFQVLNGQLVQLTP
jgi:branched-chain amino acid transport system substrate-binding protein